MRAIDHPYFDAPPLALAHRGGACDTAGLARENTLAAFEAAAAAGYRYLETDVHLTADGVLIAFHDDELDRVTDGRGRIAQLSWDQVSRARIDGTEPVPTLRELLRAPPQARVNIDLKADGTPEATLWALRELRATDRVCIGSFSSARLRRFRRLARRDGVATSAGPLGVAALRLLPAAVSRWLHTPGLAYQVPVWHRLLGMRIEVVTPGFVRAAHAIGRQVHVWTINDAAQMRRLLDLGVDGIVTDRLDLLAQVLADRGHPLDTRR